MTMAFKVVIPARYASTRLPGKPLREIAGKPMIGHVYERAKAAHAEEVVVATDDTRILSAVSDLGITAVMTRGDHHSGTERIAEVARLRGWDETTVIVNLQGDEPLIPPAYIRDVALALSNQNQAGVATLAVEIHAAEEVFNPNIVKVILNQAGYALYFSRAPIPWDRDQFNSKQCSDKMPYYRHIGIYAYTVGFLQRYIAWDASAIETVEHLEQLRILWHGEPILVTIEPDAPVAGVDTPEDLLRVEKIIMEQGI